MIYEINWQKTGFMFAVPQSLISHLNTLDETALKVVLYIFSNREHLSVEELSSSLNLKKEEVETALLSLEKKGIVTLGDITATPKPMKATLKLHKNEFAKIVDEEEAVRFLLGQAQATLGRTLTYAESNTLVTLHHFYGLDVDVILMLITYCLSQKKDNINYIQKVGIDWSNKGITDHITAEEHIRALEQQNEQEIIMKQLFGITGRNLTKRERTYASSWLSEMQIDYNLIQEAFERCVENTGKINFPYINKILVSWHKKGYTTLLDVQMEDQKLEKPQEGQKSSYDVNQLDDFLNQSPIYNKGGY